MELRSCYKASRSVGRDGNQDLRCNCPAKMRADGTACTERLNILPAEDIGDSETVVGSWIDGVERVMHPG